LKGTFAPAHHAANYWRDLNKATGQQLNARLINTSSVSGIYGNIGQTNYGAAKMGIAAFTIIASRELRRYGVTVNCIAPGALTRLTEDLGGPVTEERRRRSDPKWVAPIAVWLASEESSDVSGRMFESSGNVLAIAEGWHRGPTAEPVEDPKALGPIVKAMVAKARKNAGMNGQDLD
jgi:NAD(P)-dependent dehydrogenase (short-subunit alcohol dehydrogenase family)